jgi:hypothetical protein
MFEKNILEAILEIEKDKYEYIIIDESFKIIDYSNIDKYFNVDDFRNKDIVEIIPEIFGIEDRLTNFIEIVKIPIVFKNDYYFNISIHKKYDLEEGCFIVLLENITDTIKLQQKLIQENNCYEMESQQNGKSFCEKG